jgi:hypothetical protein
LQAPLAVAIGVLPLRGSTLRRMTVESPLHLVKAPESLVLHLFLEFRLRKT